MTTADLYKAARAELDKRAESDKQLAALLDKIHSGKATFEDTAAYNERFSNMLGETLAKYIGEPDGSGANESLCTQLLRDQHGDINALLADVQREMDGRIGLNLRPIQPRFPAERVRQLARALEDITVPQDTLQRRAASGAANVSKSFHDAYMKENAKFRSEAGLKCRITRNGSSGCCAWCAEVIGTFEFGDEPSDIFRRHDNCDCTVIYGTQVLRGKYDADGKRTKTWEEVGEVPKGFKPTVFSPEQAAEIQAQNLQFRGLTSRSERDIIITRDMANGLRRSALFPLTDEEKSHLMDEIKAIGADPSVFVFRDGIGSGYSDERDTVFLSANIFPSNDNSMHPRDRMSERAAIAHEYYGHRANRNTKLEQGVWNDEFRASYMAAKNCPNLSDEDRYYLILDALERAKEAGVSIRYNDFIRSVLYG